ICWYRACADASLSASKNSARNVISNGEAPTGATPRLSERVNETTSSQETDHYPVHCCRSECGDRAISLRTEHQYRPVLHADPGGAGRGHERSAGSHWWHGERGLGGT